MKSALIPIYAAITPFFLWPIEFFLPYPYIIEEIAKTILVFFILKEHTLKKKVLLTLLAGLLFSISESVLYIFNFALVGDSSAIVTRLLLTIPLHTLTILIILVPALIDKKLLPLGIILTILIHYYFNIIIGKI